MKWRLSYLVLILVMLLVGYVADPKIFPGGDKQVQQPTTPRDDILEIDIHKDEPKPVVQTTTEPEPEPEPEPVVVVEDTQEDAEENDPENAEITKLNRVLGEDRGQRPVQEEDVKGIIRPNEWRKPKILERKLANHIRTHLGNPDRERVLAFIRDPKNRLQITQWELLHRANMDALVDLMKDTETADSLAVLLNNLPWISSFV